VVHLITCRHNLRVIFMQEIITNKQEPRVGFNINDLSLEDKNKLVGAFAWLIKEDKKQNPALYQIKKEKND
jgi:hypothetical protein